jgi:hypothetical protein
MNHWYAADSISTQHRHQLDQEAGKDVLVRAALAKPGAESGSDLSRAHEHWAPAGWLADEWRRWAVLRLLSIARAAESWLEAQLSIVDEPAR